MENSRIITVNNSGPINNVRLHFTFQRLLIKHPTFNIVFYQLDMCTAHCCQQSQLYSANKNKQDRLSAIHESSDRQTGNQKEARQTVNQSIEATQTVNQPEKSQTDCQLIKRGQTERQPANQSKSNIQSANQRRPGRLSATQRRHIGGQTVFKPWVWVSQIDTLSITECRAERQTFRRGC